MAGLLAAGVALAGMGSLKSSTDARRRSRKTAFYTGKAYNIQQKQLQRNATAAMAQATRRAADARKQGDIMQSDARARMAAGGGSTTDAGATQIMGDIGEHTEYNVLSSLYEGGQARKALETEQEINKWLKKADKLNFKDPSLLQTGITAAGSMFQSYASGTS